MRLLIACFIVCLATAAAPVSAAETYDLLFKNGTLSDVPKDGSLQYDRVLSVQNDPEVSDNGTGVVQLTFEADEMARLKFHKDERFRNIGSFPATVGNPIIMYFVETVVRDVAANAGGSPFYIRNRVKDSLIQFAEIETLDAKFGQEDIAAQSITLRPFLNDKNRDKMKGYGDLALTVTMSEDVPGWYYSLVAEVPVTGGNAQIYRYALTLRAEE